MPSIACEKFFTFLTAYRIAQNAAKQPDVLPERQILVAQARLVHGRVQSDAKDRYKRVWKVAPVTLPDCVTVGQAMT